MGKFYAVKKGKTTGIFETWDECREAVHGFPGSVYKSFSTRKEAEAFLSGNDFWEDQIRQDIGCGWLVVFCDGSFDESEGKYSYGAVIIRGDGEDISLCDYGSDPEYIESRNVTGEILGVLASLDWALANGYEKVKIYHDYSGLSKWAIGEWKAKTPVSQMYVETLNSRFAGKLDVGFKKVKGHSNNPYNDKVDELAKAALFENKRLP